MSKVKLVPSNGDIVIIDLETIPECDTVHITDALDLSVGHRQ